MQATGKKPAWETGASMALPRRAPAAKAQSKAPAKAAWSLAPDDDGELLDDSELLTEEDLQRPTVPSRLSQSYSALQACPGVLSRCICYLLGLRDQSMRRCSPALTSPGEHHSPSKDALQCGVL